VILSVTQASVGIWGLIILAADLAGFIAWHSWGTNNQFVSGFAALLGLQFLLGFV
jgi:hypothetical protein